MNRAIEWTSDKKLRDGVRWQSACNADRSSALLIDFVQSSHEYRSEAGPGRAVAHQPGVDVGEHGVRQPVGAGVGLEGDSQAAGAKRRHVLPCVGQRDLRIPGAVHDQDREVAACLQPAQRPQADRQPAVDRDDAGEPLRKGQAQPVGDRGPFAAADQEDPLGVRVQQAAGSAGSTRRRPLPGGRSARGSCTEQAPTNDFGLRRWSQ